MKKTQSKKSQGSPILERFIQRNMVDRMNDVDEREIAKAIKTLLYGDQEKNKHLN